jgi:hypothetical protein
MTGRDHHSALDPGRTMLELGPEELFVVGALRAWVAPHMRPGEPHPDWRELFRLSGVGAPGLLGFEMLMSVLGAQAQRLLEVGCCGCPALGGDEDAMLRLVRALQAGELLGALEVLSDWLPREAVGPALRGAQRFAAEVAQAGLMLHRVPEMPSLRGIATLH